MFKIRVYPLAVFTLLLSLSAYSSSIRQLHIDQLINQSELVFKGKVLNVTTNWNKNKTEILTQVTFKIDDVISGNHTSNRLELSFVGGTVDEATVTIDGSIMPIKGESGIYFVSSVSQTLVNPLVGWAQGHFITTMDSLGVERLMTQSKHPIESIDVNQKQENYLSKGFVTGVKRVSNGRIDEAMTIDSFKNFIQERTHALKKKKSRASTQHD